MLTGRQGKKAEDFLVLMGQQSRQKGECGKEVRRRVEAGWNGWRKVPAVLLAKECQQE